MTNRERILAIIEGKKPDRLPWIPRLLLWYNAHKNAGTLPEKYRDCDLRDIEKDLGMGTPARDGHVFIKHTKNVETKAHRRDNETLIEFITPVGMVSTKYIETEKLQKVGIAPYQIEHLIKRSEDYDVVAYMIENTTFVPAYEDYIAYERNIGNDGLPLVSISDCPMHDIMREYIGYEKAVYEMVDHPERIERLLAVMTDKNREMHKIIAESPAKMIQHGAHFDSMMTPPPLYEEYFKPYFQEFAQLLHSKGKILVFHADADSSLLLDLIRESGFDMVEVFTTAPMVKCTLTQAMEAWKNEVIIWGGIPSVILCDDYSEEHFEAYMANLFDTITLEDRFIFGVADNVMPETNFERIIKIGEMLEKWSLKA
jgi:uroporphyrinogen-III decarboxylase